MIIIYASLLAIFYMRLWRAEIDYDHAVPTSRPPTHTMHLSFWRAKWKSLNENLKRKDARRADKSLFRKSCFQITFNTSQQKLFRGEVWCCRNVFGYRYQRNNPSLLLPSTHSLLGIQTSKSHLVKRNQNRESSFKRIEFAFRFHVV